MLIEVRRLMLLQTCLRSVARRPLWRFVLLWLLAAGWGAGLAAAGDEQRPPNFILILCDDLGYGDVGCFGSTKNRTPNVDRMAREGARFTSFYATSGVCTPSRSSLMTACYPRRVNMHLSARGAWVLLPGDAKGLNPQEITVAEVLRERGYATSCVGQWHLGDQPQFLPTRQGFDSYFGIPYANDMGNARPKRNYPPLPLLRNETVVETEPDQAQLTQRYTAEAIKFITANKDRPFFLYLSHTFPHWPLSASERFRDRSANGVYGAAVEEIDWSTGEILATLQKLGLDERTLVIFTSDNGAARPPGGSNAPLRGFKGSTFEGGMRVPCVMRWPGQIPAGVACDALAATLDVLPTLAGLAGGKPPTDRILDGRDIWPLMAGLPEVTTPHEVFYYYRVRQLEAVRDARWKLRLKGRELYDLQTDIGESKNVANEHPEVVRRLLALATKARADLGDGERQGEHQRPAGVVKNPKTLTTN